MHIFNTILTSHLKTTRANLPASSINETFSPWSRPTIFANSFAALTSQSSGSSGCGLESKSSTYTTCLQASIRCYQLDGKITMQRYRRMASWDMLCSPAHRLHNCDKVHFDRSGPCCRSFVAAIFRWMKMDDVIGGEGRTAEASASSTSKG